jgi:hypothetical protein
MNIGDQGYLIETGLRGLRGDKWIKPPLVELIDIQRGKRVSHYVFRSIKGKYKLTLTNTDFELCDWVFADKPDPIIKSEVPGLRARAADISRHGHSRILSKFNRGGFA